MKNYNKLPNGNRLKELLLLFVLSTVFLACEQEMPEEPLTSADASVHSLNTVKVTSTGMNFDAPDEIPSGWTTFRFQNKTGMVHFFVLQKLPGDKTLQNSLEEVVPFFQSGMDYYREGDLANAFGAAGFGNLPAWYGDIVMSGGPGLVSGGHTGTTSVYLDPGTYVIECYVKSPDGKFHSFMGMIDQIVVTEETGSTKEPDSDLSVTIGTSTGIELEKAPKRPGRHTFAVDVLDQATYGNLLQHDVHLVKVEEGGDRQLLNKWINWIYLDEEMEGFVAPAPSGFTFMGGLQEIPAGKRGYFTAVLTPGDYVLISEVDDPISKGLYAEFEVR